jgi:hypothetical protein
MQQIYDGVCGSESILYNKLVNSGFAKRHKHKQWDPKTGHSTYFYMITDKGRRWIKSRRGSQARMIQRYLLQHHKVESYFTGKSMTFVHGNTTATIPLKKLPTWGYPVAELLSKAFKFDLYADSYKAVHVCNPKVTAWLAEHKDAVWERDTPLGHIVLKFSPPSQNPDCKCYSFYELNDKYFCIQPAERVASGDDTIIRLQYLNYKVIDLLVIAVFQNRRCPMCNAELIGLGYSRGVRYCPICGGDVRKHMETVLELSST